MKVKRKKRIALIVLLLVIVFILSLPVTVYFMSYEKFSNDENLFSAVRKKGVTKLYYDGSGNFGEEISGYVPIKFAELGMTEKKDWVSYGDVSEHIKNGFIAVEDRLFFEHSGINVKRTFAAMLNFIFKRDSSFGGSTITQQVIKNISGENEKSVKRKVTEIFRAIHLEKNHSKEEIFEVYLNIAPMGEGVIGVELASERYFGKKSSDLTIAEAATIVGITNAPERYSPIRQPERCLNKRNKVLDSMHEMNYITDAEYEDAVNAPLSVIKENFLDSERSSWFVESVYDDVCRDLMKKYGYSRNAAEVMLKNGGLSIYTTIDKSIQEKLEEYFENKNNFPEEINDGLQYSMVIVDSVTGSLRGIVGGVGEKNRGRILNYATVPRTPGSVLKPLALYAPLIDSKKITWATLFDDSPVSYKENSSGEMVGYPKNSPPIYEGEITVAKALEKSKNTVAVRLYELLGADSIFNNLKFNYGFSTLIENEKQSNGRILTDKAASPLALGQLTYGIPLRSLVEAYTVFPGDGELCSPKSYVAIYDSEGHEILTKTTEKRRIISAECARIMNQLLSGVVENGTASSVTLNQLVDTAGKTGTSGASKDKMFVGYTPYYTAGIWCGYSDSSKSVSYVPQNHLKVWDDIMCQIHSGIYDSGMKEFPVLGLEKKAICLDSGKLFNFGCAEEKNHVSYGYFINGTAPYDLCDYHAVSKKEE